MSSNRSPERAVTEMGVSWSDSAVLRAVTTTSSKVALAVVERPATAIANRQAEVQLLLTEVAIKFEDLNLCNPDTSGIFFSECVIT